MITKARTIEVDATPPQVWAVLGRFMHIEEFHPRVTTVDALSETKTGVGAIRRCHFKDGSSAVEKVIGWKEGASYEVALSEFTLPLKQLFATFSVEPVTPDRSRLVMQLRYQVKFGPIGWLMGQTMMASMMGKMMLMVLGGLKNRVTAQQHPSAAA